MKQITQIKKYGDSVVIRLEKEFREFQKLKVGDWVDISDIVKIKKRTDNEEDRKTNTA